MQIQEREDRIKKLTLELKREKKALRLQLKLRELDTPPLSGVK
jgi:hypothetical protein